MMILRSACAIAAAMALTACSPDGLPLNPVPPPDPAALASLRAGYGLPDCPETDPGATPVEGGLPQTALDCLGGSSPVNLAGLPRIPTIVNVWAQWCGPCREESPFLREALQQLDGVAFVGVDYDDPRPDWAVEFAGKAGWAYPHVADPDKSLQVPLRVPGVPSTYFIAADGTIAAVHAGQLTSTEQLLDLAERHLGVS